MSKQHNEITGVIIDDSVTFTLEELCEACGVEEELIREMVAHGLLEPLGITSKQWQFTIVEVKRSKTALHLQRDLEINLAGIAVILDLLDEMEELRTRLNLLDHP